MVQHSDSVADVIVVGGGLAGMIAANRLAQLGRSPIVLEQGSEAAYLCNSRYTGGSFHVCYLDPIGRQPEELQKQILAKNNSAVPQLVDAVATDTRRVIPWLRETGVKFVKADAREDHSWVLSPPRQNTYGLVWKGRGGDVALRTLEAALEARGGVLRRGVRAVALDVKNTDFVVAEVIEGAQSHRIRADAVVIADGGFQGNSDLLRKFVTSNPASLLQRGAGTGRGDGLKMAMEAGADYAGENRFYGHVMSKDALTNERLSPFPYLDALVQAAIVVDGSARRFVDEGQGGVWIANNIAWLSDPLSTVAIFDDAIWCGPAAHGFMSPNPHLLNGGGRVYSASSIRELAAAVDLPAEVLMRTVDEYNAAIAANSLDRLTPLRVSTYCKPIPILKPPFHALPLCAGITYTMGGIAIDQHSRALNRDGRPLERIYAAGCATGGLEGGSSGSGYVGGLAKSGVTALRAAEHIAGRLC